MSLLADSTTKLLDEAGLSPSEIKIYTKSGYDLLQSKDIVKKTALPRATVQAGLSTLEDIGLCSVTEKNAKTNFYQMLPLQNLKKYLAKDSLRTHNLMAEIDKLADMAAVSSLIVTQTTNSQKGVADFLNMALFCKSRRWNIISPYDNALRHLSVNYINYFKQTRQERKIVSQTLWEEEWNKHELNLGQLLMRKPRFIPSDIAQKVPALIMTFDDNLLVISGKTNPYAEMITSQQIVDTFNIVFELAWRSCKK